MAKSFVLFLLLSVLLVSVSAIVLEHHEQQQQVSDCKQTCERARLPQHLLQECKDRCERDARDPSQKQRDPQKEYRECKQQCQRESEPEQGRRQQQKLEDCQRQCKERYEERQGKGGDTERESAGGQDNNPYVFEDQHFQTIRAEHGRLRILPKFFEHSKLLRGYINSFRFAYLEANPQTFMLPNHLDAELVIVVIQGQGRISLVRSQGRQSVNLKPGDIVRVPAGTTAYLINSDKNEKLVIAKLIQPISTPGEFEAFFGAGAKNPESFLRAFSSEILNAAYNSKGDNLERFLDQQKGEFVQKVSEEQIRALSRHDEEGGKSIWPFGGESKNKINLFEQRPIESNEFGELREVNPSDFRQLEDVDVTVSFANITKGGMTTILFNSKSIKLSVVTKGEGQLEMACPHLSQESQQGQGHGGSQEGQGRREGRGGSQEQGSQSYEKVQAQLKPGVVFIVPPGHPYTTVASNNQNLEVLCFEINSRNNERTPLAGKNNIFNQFEKEALELTFNRPSREARDLFGGQKNAFFTKGPRQQQEGRADE